MTTITKDRISSHVEWKRPFNVYGEPLCGDYREAGGEKLFVVEFGSIHKYALYVYSEHTNQWFANAATKEWSRQSPAGKAAHLARPKGQELTYLSNADMYELVRWGVGHVVVRKFHQAIRGRK